MAHANVIYSRHILATTSNKLRLPGKSFTFTHVHC